MCYIKINKENGDKTHNLKVADSNPAPATKLKIIFTVQLNKVFIIKNLRETKFVI